MSENVSDNLPEEPDPQRPNDEESTAMPEQVDSPAEEVESAVQGESAPESEEAAPAAAGEAPPSEASAAEVTPPDDGSQAPTRPGMKWYVLRVASNKEEQVAEALSRKVRLEELDEQVGRVLVPTAKEKRMKAGQVKIVQKKLYPGYVFVEMATESDGSVMENVWFMIKETMGVGDFIGSDGKPTSMKDHDVEMMLAAAAKPEEQATLKGMEFTKGDRVKIREGSFENYEGNVDTIDETKGVVTVLLTIFGRATPVDVEYWQLEKL